MHAPDLLGFLRESPSAPPGMPRIIIIAGPNGAGKTSFAEEFLPREGDCPEFVNADLIAAGLSPFNPERAAIAAGRLMLKRIHELVNQGTSFAFETTLASQTFVPLIPQWRQQGFRVTLCFLRLPDPDFAIRRVAQRVSFGGHHIPEDVIRRRFARGLENLKNLYLNRVDEWGIYDSTVSPVRLITRGVNAPDQTVMEEAATYRTEETQSKSADLPEDSVLHGAEAALQRASEKAIARARAAGLEPVIRTIEEAKGDE